MLFNTATDNLTTDESSFNKNNVQQSETSAITSTSKRYII